MTFSCPGGSFFFFGRAGSLLLGGFFSSCGLQEILYPWRVDVSFRGPLLSQSTGSRARGLQCLPRVGSAVTVPGPRSTGSIVVAHKA